MSLPSMDIVERTRSALDYPKSARIMQASLQTQSQPVTRTEKKSKRKPQPTIQFRIDQASPLVKPNMHLIITRPTIKTKS